MSNHNLMMSLAGISAGLGRAPKRKLTGAAKDLHHIRKLPESLRDVARSRYEAIIARMKAQREAEMGEFYKLFPEVMPFEAKKADKIVSAFLIGQPAAISNVDTDGVSLRVNGETVAARKSLNDRFITVCPGAFGTDKPSRYVANSALRFLGTGVRVNDILRESGDGQGYAFIAAASSGSRGGRVLFDNPNACFRVEVNKTIRNRAMATAYGPNAEYGMQEEMGPRQEYDTEAAKAYYAAQPGRKAKSSRPMGKKKKARLQKKAAGRRGQYAYSRDSKYYATPKKK